MEAKHREALIDKTPGGMAFDIAGQMAPTIVPAAKAMQIGGRMAALPSAMRAAGVGAAEAAATTTGDRGTAALWGAGGGAGGEMIGRALPGAIKKWATPSRDAQALMDAGIRIPSWKQGGQMMSDTAERFRALPFAGTAMRKAEQRAMGDMNKRLVQAAAPPGRRVSATGREGLRQLKRQWDDVFDQAYRGRQFMPDEKVFGDLRDALAVVEADFRGMSGQLTPRGDEIGGFINKIGRDLAKYQKMNYGELKALRRQIDDYISTLYKGGDARGADNLRQAAEALDELAMRALPAQEAAYIKSIGRPFGNFKRYQRAMTMKGAQNADMVSPDQMLSATKALDRSPGKSRFAAGQASDNQGALQTMADVMGGDIPKVGPGTAEKGLMAYGLMNPKAGAAMAAGAVAVPLYEAAHAIARKYGIPLAQAMEIAQRSGYGQAAAAGIASNSGEQ